MVAVTLHVGTGTFVPIRTARVEEHSMHRERFVVPESTARTVAAARRDGRLVVAVGTTVVRTLESAWDGAAVRAGAADTDLFIYPGYRFQVVDQLLTNFHTPGSTLLAMVSALAGERLIRTAYALQCATAVAQRYRFFSYGDAMRCERRSCGRRYGARGCCALRRARSADAEHRTADIGFRKSQPAGRWAGCARWRTMRPRGSVQPRACRCCQMRANTASREPLPSTRRTVTPRSANWRSTTR